MKSKLLTKIIAGIILGIISAVIIYFLTNNMLLKNLFYSFEARTYDWRVTSAVEDVGRESIEDIVIIDVDERSIKELGKFSQWSRSYYPQVINFLNEGGVSAIGIDIIFDKDIREPQEDEKFIQAVQSAGNVYNAIYFSEADSFTFRYPMNNEPDGFEWQKFTFSFPAKITKNFREEERLENEFVDLLNASKGVGHVNFRSDVDGVVRKIHLFNNFNNHNYPSLPFKMYLDLMKIDSLSFEQKGKLKLYQKEKLISEIPIDENGNMLISYFGSWKTFRYIPFYDVLKERVPKEYFKDKIVLIGVTLTGEFDLRSIPVQPAFPGVEINANILKTLLTEKYVKQMIPMNSFLLILAIGVIIGIITVFLSPIWGILVVFLLSLIYIFIVFNIFIDTNYWIEIVNPLLTILITFGGVYLYKYITEEKNKRFIRHAFSHFVTQSVVDELLANPEKIKLGGERKVCTVLFSDVVGFTTLSEQLTPEALVSLLNQYLTEMTNVIFKYDGMLDKYEGDAIMAVFGAPIAHGNHALNSCLAALDMQEQLEKLRALWGKQGKPQLYARVGINTGTMVVGNMGSENRFDYTVMGDAVNLGARLESANKQYGTFIMIGENTYQAAKDHLIVRELDLVRVKGKTELVRIYELISIKEKGISDQKSELIDNYNKGFTNYLNQNWDEAIKYFMMSYNIDQNDGPSKTYIQRCRQFKENPPGEGWDGGFVFRTK
jgi:adenylate cyclase